MRVKTTDKNNKGFAHFLAAGVAVAFAALIIAATRENAVLSEEWSRFGVPEWAKEVGSVRRVDFDHYVNHKFDSREPIVVEHSPARYWNAAKSWNEAYVKSKIKTLKRVRATIDGSNVFVYESNDRMMRRWADAVNNSALEKRNIHVFDTMTSQEFFAETKRRYYYSHTFDSELEAALGDDTAPRDFYKSFGAPDFENMSPFNLWIARTGTVTGMHFDPMHNAFLQVRGCKRFVLANASASDALKLHSYWHPRDRQSQLESNCNNDYNSPISALVADLGPGDILLLPAFIFHRVSVIPCPNAAERSAFSFSLNTWWDSKGKLIFDEYASIERIPSMTTASLAAVLRKLISGLFAGTEPGVFARNLVQQRYMTRPELSVAMGCSSTKIDRCPSMSSSSSSLADDQALSWANQAVADFGTLSSGVAKILLSDLIERIVALTVSLPNCAHFCSALLRPNKNKSICLIFS